MKVWCVQHREGWCAVKGNFEPKEGSWEVPTACGYYIPLPYGYANRMPTCSDCRILLKGLSP